MADLLQWQLSNGVVIELDRDSKAVRVFSRNVRLHFEYGDPKEIIKILAASPTSSPASPAACINRASEIET